MARQRLASDFPQNATSETKQAELAKSPQKVLITPLTPKELKQQQKEEEKKEKERKKKEKLEKQEEDRR